MIKKVFLGTLLAGVTYWWLTKDHFDQSLIRNQRVLVTGASSGIGEQLAYEYSKLGARVMITARRESLLKSVSLKCLELGAKQVAVLPADMSKPEDRTRLIQFVQAQLGGLDHLILNHATLRIQCWKGGQQDMVTLRNDLEVNFVSFVDLASRALPMLTESKGRIGVVSSTGGKMGLAGFPHYGATKFALQGFFSSLRQELECNNTGISVTLFIPGLINTHTGSRLVAMNYRNPGPVLDQMVSVEDSAVEFLKGVSNRVYEVYYPYATWVLLTVQPFFPGYIEHYIASFL